MKYKDLGIVLLFILNFCHFGYSYNGEEKAALERKLFDLPDVSFNLISKECEWPLIYQLHIRQWTNHQDKKDGAFLWQRHFTNKL